jgi:hypothetical protein
MKGSLCVLIICSVFCLCACQPAHLESSDVRLTGFLASFRRDAALRGKTLPDFTYFTLRVIPASDVPGLNGICHKSEGSITYGGSVQWRSVEISDQTLVGDEFAALVTVYHELGHCFLDLEHNDNQISIRVERGSGFFYELMPVSLMQAKYFNPNQVPLAKAYWKEYVDQLFGVVSNPFEATLK